MGRDEGAAVLRVSVAYSPRPGVADEVTVALPAGATVADALHASGLQARHPALDVTAAPIGIWGARCTPGAALRDGDRVEVYRPLCVDPMQARRLRLRKQRDDASPPNNTARRPRPAR